MTTLQAIQNTIAPELKRLNLRIGDQLHTSNALMNSVVESQLSAKGKQIRPVFLILCAKLLGSVNDNTISAAAAVELLHNATLIHDDVVDDSRIRRGRQTINAIWDNHIAVLAGDYYVSCAMQQAINTGNIKIIEALCELGKTLSIGEIDQINNARYHTLTEESYYEIITNKTASLFVACAKMACYAASVFDERVQKLCEFARLLGLCFQLRDDVFDYFNSGVVGKPTGNDLREGKITLPLIYALSRTELPEHDAMLKLSQQELLSDEEISRLTTYAVENGGIDHTFNRMHQLRDKAAEIIDGFTPCEASQALISIFDYIISREY